MFPRLEFLAYFIVGLVGICAYLFEPHMSRPAFIAIVVSQLLVLGYLCRHLAKRFKFEGRAARLDS